LRLHGRNQGPDRSRLDFSNYGSVVDAHGWGREVDNLRLWRPAGRRGEGAWYTDRFSGTSSASTTVVGALACAQGARRTRPAPLFTPTTARTLLRETGAAQRTRRDALRRSGSATVPASGSSGDGRSIAGEKR
jgi:hypothetical protein